MEKITARTVVEACEDVLAGGGVIQPRESRLVVATNK